MAERLAGEYPVRTVCRVLSVASSSFYYRPSQPEDSSLKATISELAGKHSLHPNQISQWKRQLLEGGVDVFAGNGSQDSQAQEAMQAELYEQIGRLKMELEWLKKTRSAKLTGP